MTDQIAAILARWATDEGKPYKGSLIDMDAYKASPDNIGCMCAQGQVLHLVGEWTPERLNHTQQSEADAETAKLLKISSSHAVLLRQINDSIVGAPAIVLTSPGKVLGDQWSTILDFWYALDRLPSAAEESVWKAPGAETWGYAGGDAANDAWEAAKEAAGTVARNSAWKAAWGSAGSASWAAAGCGAATDAWDASGASNEIQAAKIFRRNDKALYFLPLFGFANPEDIPERPADYGMGCHSQETTQ